jgi:uncharacterized protein YhaN
MSRDPRALIFERIFVQRMPGIADGGFELKGLAAGINIVHGPNASGKTTTARALESLLWPRAAAPPRAVLGAHFHLDGREWSADLDGQNATYQRDGKDADPPLLPPAESRDRYRLSLHELLSAENRSFADEIVRESAGGYDLARAAASLHIRTGASRRGREAEALAEARSRLSAARTEESALQQDERRLDELTAKLETAKSAARRERLREHAVDYAVAAAAEAEASAAFAAFPRELALLRGDEADRLAGIRGQLAEAERALAAAETDLLKAESELQRSGLPGEGIDDEALDTLRARHALLRSLEQEIASKERGLGGARETSAEELRRIGEVADAAKLRELDVVALDELAGFAEEAGKIRAAEQAAEARLKLLASAPDPDAGNPERVGKGILLLQQWLRTGTGEGPDSADRLRRMRTLGAIAAGLLAGAGVVAFGLGLAHAIALSLILAGGLLLSLILRPAPAAADPRQEYRREYERLGLERPREWEPDEVTASLDRLESLRAQVRLAAERTAERERLEPELEAARAEWTTLEARRQELAGRFGVTPELDPAAFHILANRISRWQDAERLATAHTAELEHLRGEYRAALTISAERLAAFGYGAIEDVAELTGAIDGLTRRVERHRLALTDRRHAESRVAGSRKEIDALRAERRGIFERCGLDGDDGAARVMTAAPGVGIAADETASDEAAADPSAATPASADPELLIREWCAHHGSYGEAVKRRQEVEARRQGAHERLARTDGYYPGLEDRGADELRAELEEVESLAADADEIGKAIAEIEARLEIARRGHAVEDALAEVERCEAALREVRERDILGVVGNALLEYIQRATRDAHRPPVFRRAQELFAQFTRGRYTLDFEEGASPAFRALDTTTGRGHALDELSSGTRVQLLLAVRLAFVESLESGARLPLIFDETLGNSDDDRAAAIMEATIALAAEGRQVFYFTAQPDEVGKWRGMLEGATRNPGEQVAGGAEHAGGERRLEWAIIDLAEARKLARHEAAPALPVISPPDPGPPPPAGMNHDEYGLALLVPGVDLFADPSGVHLWHLVEDPELLHRLLSRRLESWGALRALVEHGGEALLGDDAREYPRIRAAARALEAALALARIGRGRPVDRDAIEESAAVTETFMPRVVQLLGEVEGDGARLIAEIEGGALPRFHASRRELLRDYLEEHGYLDPRDPVGPEEFRARIFAEVAAEITAGQLAAEMVDRIIGRLAVGAAHLAMALHLARD